MSIPCSKSGLLHIGILDADLVVPLPEVNLGEELGSLQAVEKIVYPRQRVDILLGDLVEGSIVRTHTGRAIFLLDEQYGCTIR